MSFLQYRVQTVPKHHQGIAGSTQRCDAVGGDLQIPLGSTAPLGFGVTRGRLDQTFLLQPVQGDVDGPSRNATARAGFQFLEDQRRIGILTDLENCQENRLLERAEHAVVAHADNVSMVDEKPN
jgi:hypothetical protein